MQIYKPACRNVSKSTGISSLAKSDEGVESQGSRKTEGNGAGSIRSTASASAEKTLVKGVIIFCVC